MPSVPGRVPSRRRTARRRNSGSARRRTSRRCSWRRRVGAQPSVEHAPGRCGTHAPSRVKSALGSSPISSAKRQKSSRIRKWAALLRVGSGGSQQVGQTPELSGGGFGDLGRGLGDAELVGVEEDGVQLRTAGGSEQFGQGQGDGLVGCVDELRMDDDLVEIADDEEGRVLQVFAVVEDLAVGGVEVGVFALVFPGEVALLPDVGPTLLAAELLGARLRR